MDTRSRSQKPHETLPSGPAPASLGRFDLWSIKRLLEEIPCVIEDTLSCVPLEDDPVCRACWQTLKEETDEQGH